MDTQSEEHDTDTSHYPGKYNVKNDGSTQGQVVGEHVYVTMHFGSNQEEYKPPQQSSSNNRDHSQESHYQVPEDPTGPHQEDTSVNSGHDQQNASIWETVAGGPNPKRPATVFLSYEQHNADEVAILERELKLRGVKPWRDVADLRMGRPVKEGITDSIACQTDALLIYLTPESLASSFIWEVEIPAALQRHERDHSFSIIPVLRGVTSSEVQRLCASYGLRSLKDFDFDTLPDPQIDQAEFNEKCRKVAN